MLGTRPLFAHDIQHLAANHAERPGTLTEDRNGAADLSGVFQFCPCGHGESIRQQGIPGQHSHSLAVNLMVGQAAPAVIVIIHARQVIVDQTVGMDHLHGSPEGQSLFRLFSAHPAEFQGQNGAQPFSACQEAVVGCLKNWLLRLRCKGGIDRSQIRFDFFPINTGLFLKFHRQRVPPEGHRRPRL